MASIVSTLKPLSPFSPFLKQPNNSNNHYYNSVLFTYYRPVYTDLSVARKKNTFVAVHDASDQVESSWRIPFSKVVVCGGEENVNDLLRQPFYRFLQRTYLLHLMAFALVLYFCGGMPFLVWGFGVATIVRFHGTFMVNSVCHIWGTRAWNTPDLSKNNWWVALLTFGEGWHNNHHAFDFSARHGLEWWQIDVTWYIIRFLEVIGLATNVKLPTEAQKKRMALL